MSISIKREAIMSLALAAAWWREKTGRKTSPTSLWRWSQRGYRGTRLEVLRTPSGLLTSLEALQRFFDALECVQAGRRPKPAPLSDEEAEAEAILDAAGI